MALTRLRERKRPPPLRIVETTEDSPESSSDEVRLPRVDQLDNQFVLGLAGLRLSSPHPCRQATVHEGGFVRLILSHGVTVDVTPEQAFRVSNPSQGSSFAISSCGRQTAFVHPAGWQQYFLLLSVSTNTFREAVAVWAKNRVAGGKIRSFLQRVNLGFLQVEDAMSVKNAKIWPKGISFTATTCALVYLLDEAGLRTTSDIFHDLYASDVVDSLWDHEVMSRSMLASRMRDAREMVEGRRRWRCWILLILLFA